MNDIKTWEGRARDAGDFPCYDGDQLIPHMRAEIAELRAALAARATPAQPVPHSDDLAVDRFAAAMKAKMAASRAKGRGGWDDERQCPMAKLSNMLIAHARKGDPVDVANFAMMLHQREQMEIEHHPCHAGIATVSLRSAMDELLGTVDGENMDWKERATIMALEKIAQPSPSSVGAAIRKLPLPEPLGDIQFMRPQGYFGRLHGYGATQVRALLSEAAAIAEQVQGQQPEPQQFGAVQTVCMDGHQLKEALEFLAPDRDEDPDQLDDWLTFGVVKHKDDDGNVSTGLCCWNDDTDGVYPLHDAAPSIAQDGQGGNHG
jgi:hypothetical protein